MRAISMRRRILVSDLDAHPGIGGRRRATAGKYRCARFRCGGGFWFPIWMHILELEAADARQQGSIDARDFDAAADFGFRSGCTSWNWRPPTRDSREV